MTITSWGSLCAQPGFIRDPAVPAINPMDPDGNGFVTSTGVAFTGPLDESQFELPFLPLQQFENEHGADNQYAAGCEFYELVNDPVSGADAAYYYYKDPDGIPDNGDELIVFRFRLAKFSPSATAFSILIDTDYKFGFDGLEADPNAVPGNPGFEKEVAAYNSTGAAGGVRVFDVDGRTEDNVVAYYAPMTSHYQASYALNRSASPSCGTDLPAFVDMYVPFSSLGITASTQIRMAAATNEDIDNTLGGKAHDIGGVNGNATPDDDAQFMAAINNYSPIHLINPAHRAPVAQDASAVIVEYAADGTVVHTVSATDADADILSFSIVAGNSLSAFSINSSTGKISVANSSALDFESTPVIRLLVRISDGALYDNAVITINLANVNEAPTAADAVVSVPENSGIGSSVHFMQASDPDANTTLHYSITGGNTAGTFAMNIASGEITVSNPGLLDFENPVTFTLQVQVTDGLLADQATVKVTVSDVNESPNAQDGMISIDENTVEGTSVYTVLATDPDVGAVLNYSIVDGNTGTAFSIENTSGEIIVNNSHHLNFETTPIFLLTVRVSDGSLFTDAVTRVNLQNVNEPPVIDDATVTIQTRVSDTDVIHTLLARDPESDEVSYSIESGDPLGLFAVAGETGDVSVADAETLNLRPETFDLAIRATDSQGLSGNAMLRIVAARHFDRNDIQPQKGFSPNQDGNNDYWLIPGIEAFPDNFISVFNRWGMLVYEADGYDNEGTVWRGEGKGSAELESTYFFIIKAGDFEPITGYLIVKP